MAHSFDSDAADCVDRCGAIGYAYAGLQVGVSFCILYCSYYAVVAFDTRSSRSVVSMNAIVEMLMRVSVHRPHAQWLVSMDSNVVGHGRTASIGPIHRIQQNRILAVRNLAVAGLMLKAEMLSFF
jgi:hypothetical protein